MVLMALIVAPMMELMALNVVKYYNEYELKKTSKEKREPVSYSSILFSCYEAYWMH